MGSELLEITERLARAAMAADADDPVSMAEIHTLLGELASRGEEEGEGLKERVGSAIQLAESVILRDARDASASVKQLCTTVAEIQQIISGAADGKPFVPVVAEVAKAEVPAPVAAPPVAAETRLKEEDLPLVAEFINEAASHLENAEAELLKLEANPEDPDAINAVFRAFHTIKGVAGFLDLKDIGSLAHAAESLLDLGRKGKVQIAGGNFDIVLEASDAMKSLLGALDKAAKERTAMVREPALERLIHRLHIAASGEEAAKAAPEAGPKTAAPPEITQAAPATTARIESSPEAITAKAAQKSEAASSQRMATADTVKVATDRLDNLINVVGELVIAHSMSKQDVMRVASADQRLLRNMAHLGKITRELQDLSMSMRMVPIQGVFQKMTRLVRDSARKANKDIDLVLIGAETELDRNVVEAISDPLVHMVRNAADHGIENPDDRVKAGKPATGRLELKAYHQAGNIVIEVTDDGKGLNKARILKKAKEAGIIREGQELSEQEIFRLIFHAGLSTAEKVTDVSGRGVGMDVVRKNVEALRGRIEISSVDGKGSTFTIKLPLTLAVIDGLIVKVGKETFILPITSIEQSLRPTGEQISTVQGRGEMCLVRGRLLPVIRLHRLFGIKPQQEDPTKSLVVIVHDNERRCCLLIDELLGQQQVVIKSLGKLLGQVQGTSGGAIMGDGCISLILDVPGSIDLATEH